MKKIVLGALILILVAAIAVAGFWWFSRPQIIILSNGTKLTLLGVTYGKHHVPPKITIAGKRIRSQARWDATNDVGVVWVEAEYKPSNWPNFQLVISDKAGTGAVTSWSQTQYQVRNGVSVMGYILNAFPRRDSSMVLRVLAYGNNGQRLAKGQFTVSNPAHGPFPMWATVPLPDTESDGDLDVSLTNFSSDAKLPYRQYNGLAQNDPLNKAVQLGFDVEQKGHPATNWQPVQVIMSDATGNQITGWINRNYQNGQSGYFCQSSLWPNEPDWKLRVEFSRSSGFNDDEVWTLTNLPVKQGTEQEANEFWNYRNEKKVTLAQNTLSGIQVQAYPPIEYSNSYPGMNNGRNNKVVEIAFKADPDPDSAGMRMNVLKITDDQGHELQSQGSGWGSGMYEYQFSVPRNTQSVNVTIALHKSRFVEFNVKPAK
ncbi:MAG TPA: hypothetical protein VGI03_06500 [Verrucomicrobiae bacterium]|jgi:hypothetical protein